MTTQTDLIGTLVEFNEQNDGQGNKRPGRIRATSNTSCGTPYVYIQTADGQMWERTLTKVRILTSEDIKRYSGSLLHL